MLKQRLEAVAHRVTTAPVVATDGARLHLERGDLSILADVDKVAIIASWSATEAMSRSLSEYAFALAECGFACVVVSTSEVGAPLVWPHGLPQGTIVARRRNVGYDFGTWASALEALPGVRSKQHVLLTNDSMVGPFGPLDQIVARATSSKAGLVGLTDTFQIGHSIQSYFMMFNQGVLDCPEWRRFFRGVRPQEEKLDYVWRYELKVAPVAVSGGFGWEVLFPTALVDALHHNPTLDQWRELVDSGFPFVKRTLWSDPDLGDRAEHASVYLGKLFGIQTADWLPDVPVASLPGFEREIEKGDRPQ